MQGLLKNWLKRVIPFPLSKNHRYDILTRQIIQRFTRPGSNCIDVGCHEGEVLDLFLRFCPKGQHFAFEPIPSLYQKLLIKYQKNPNCTIYDYALSDTEGLAAFNYVVTNPAYSGLQKRNYDRAYEKEETIRVRKRALDNVIPADLPVHFIKIDVEGGDLDVMTGAKNTIIKYQPVIIFEFGIGGSDIYGASPATLYTFMKEINYSVSLLDSFLQDKTALSPEEFDKQFNEKRNYYFVASPKR
jgi:FkbM family methyltransferase